MQNGNPIMTPPKALDVAQINEPVSVLRVVGTIGIHKSWASKTGFIASDVTVYGSTLSTNLLILVVSTHFLTSK